MVGSPVFGLTHRRPLAGSAPVGGRGQQAAGRVHHLEAAHASSDSHRSTYRRPPSGVRRRRARTMLEFAADLRATGRVRADLTDQQVADVVWSTNAAEYWDLLVRQREWSPDEFAGWLADAWGRLLLA